MSERVDVAADIPDKYGLECSYYERINERTQHLKEALYIEVEVDGEFLFRPGLPQEHFPIVAFRTHAMNTTHAYGKGRPLLAVVRCHAPTLEVAEQAARIVAAAIEEATQTLEWSEISRSVSSFFAGVRYKRSLDRNPETLAYRPPKEARSTLEPPPMPVKDGSYADFQETLAELNEVRERAARNWREVAEKSRAIMRDALPDGWGMLEAYDEMQAQRKKEAEVQQSPWTMEAVHASRERWEDLWTQ